MKVGVYAMRDQLTGFLTPTFETNDNVATRNFKYALNRKDTLLYASAKHFDLYKLGEFDSDTGLFDSAIPELLVTGLSVIEVTADEV